MIANQFQLNNCYTLVQTRTCSSSSHSVRHSVMCTKLTRWHLLTYVVALSLMGRSWGIYRAPADGCPSWYELDTSRPGELITHWGWDFHHTLAVTVKCLVHPTLSLIPPILVSTCKLQLQVYGLVAHVNCQLVFAKSHIDSRLRHTATFLCQPPAGAALISCTATIGSRRCEVDPTTQSAAGSEVSACRVYQPHGSFDDPI